MQNPPPSNNQKKLVGWFIGTALLIAGLMGFSSLYPKPSTEPGTQDPGLSFDELTPEALMSAEFNVETGDQRTQAATNKAMFRGIKAVSPQQVAALFPNRGERPLLLEFKSKYCLDCKKMAPILERVLENHPEIEAKLLDVAADRSEYKAVFEAFQPATVPIIVFISANGEISNVLYDFQDEASLQNAVTQL